MPAGQQRMFLQLRPTLAGFKEDGVAHNACRNRPQAVYTCRNRHALVSFGDAVAVQRTDIIERIRDDDCAVKPVVGAVV